VWIGAWFGAAGAWLSGTAPASIRVTPRVSSPSTPQKNQILSIRNAARIGPIHVIGKTRKHPKCPLMGDCLSPYAGAFSKPSNKGVGQ
jgi:hypothetical protein